MSGGWQQVGEPARTNTPSVQWNTSSGFGFPSGKQWAHSACYEGVCPRETWDNLDFIANKFKMLDFEIRMAK